MQLYSRMLTVHPVRVIALHLAALDCPKQRAYEVATLLFIGGARHTAVSEDRRTPVQIAKDVRNDEFLSAYADYKRARDDTVILQKLTKLRDHLNAKYCFQTNTKIRGTVEHFEAKFTLPDFLFMDTARTGNMPEELQIHEHQIRPLTKTGFNDMEGLEAINCLTFSVDQALINKHRRERLLEHAEKDFQPVHVPNT
jgi:ankyrin repeat protein